MKTMIMCLKGSAAGLQRVIREIAFVDYCSARRLQEAFIGDLSSEKGKFKKEDIEIAYERRKAFVKLWHQAIPLFFCFIPLWLYLAYPALQGKLSSLQSVVIFATIITTGLCYLQTFYRDGLNYQLSLVRIRESLLTGSISQALATSATPKGCIRLLLLHELIQKEAERPNIFKGTINEAIPFYKALIGFNEKNFKKVYFQYRSRDEIRIDTDNARTTHECYLDILVHHYQAIGDTALEQKAVDLQIFLKRKQSKK